MEKFKSNLKKKLNIMKAFDLLAVIFIILTTFYSKPAVNGTEITDMIHGFQVGLFIGLQIIMIKYIIKYTKALKNQDALKKLYIEESDERTKLIKDKIGGVGFNFSLAFIATAAIISGFFNQIVFITLCAVMMFMALVKLFLKIYYKNKF